MGIATLSLQNPYRLSGITIFSRILEKTWHAGIGILFEELNYVVQFQAHKHYVWLSLTSFSLRI